MLYTLNYTTFIKNKIKILKSGRGVSEQNGGKAEGGNKVAKKSQVDRVKRGKEITLRSVYTLLREKLDKDRKQQGGEIIRRIMRGKYIKEQKGRVRAWNSRCRRRRQTHYIAQGHHLSSPGHWL